MADMPVEPLTDQLRAWAKSFPVSPFAEAADTITRLQAALDEAFDFLGGCDGASEIRDKILAAQRSVGGE